MDQSPDSREFEESFLHALGGEIPSAISNRFLAHAKLLLHRTEQVNLTALRKPQDLAQKLYWPSWKIGTLRDLRRLTVLDLGSGAGFPGIPLALSNPDSKWICVDSIQKKANFIDESIRELKIANAQAICARGEEYLKKQRVDAIVAQAVKSTREILHLLSPVKNSFRQLYLMKGKSWAEESSQHEEKELGFERTANLEYEIPGLYEKRFLLCFEPRASR